MNAAVESQHAGSGRRRGGVSLERQTVSGAAIRFAGATVRYPGADRAAIEDVSFEVSPGELVVLLGPSGCGKSTLLRTVNRLVPLERRKRRASTAATLRRVDAVELRRSIGYAIQAVGLFAHMTVAQNVAVVPSLLGWPRDEIGARVDELLALVGLEPVALSQPASARTLRRRGAARRRRARDCGAAARAADGRAVRRGRRARARLAAARTRAHRPRARNDDALRHARFRRGAQARRPDRRDARAAASNRSQHRSSCSTGRRRRTCATSCTPATTSIAGTTCTCAKRSRNADGSHGLRARASGRIAALTAAHVELVAAALAVALVIAASARRVCGAPPASLELGARRCSARSTRFPASRCWRFSWNSSGSASRRSSSRWSSTRSSCSRATSSPASTASIGRKSTPRADWACPPRQILVARRVSAGASRGHRRRPRRGDRLDRDRDARRLRGRQRV